MEKSTMSFLSRLLGKKKNGCCGVVVEEIEQDNGAEHPTDQQGKKCCTKAAGKEAESNL